MKGRILFFGVDLTKNIPGKPIILTSPIIALHIDASILILRERTLGTEDLASLVVVRSGTVLETNHGSGIRSFAEMRGLVTYLNICDGNRALAEIIKSINTNL